MLAVERHGRSAGRQGTRESQMRFRWGNGSGGGLLQWGVTIAVLLIGGSLATLFFAVVAKHAGPVCPNCEIPYGPTPVSPAAMTIPAGGPAAGSPAEGNRFARGLLTQVGLAADPPGLAR
jgi:hypothetical protein